MSLRDYKVLTEKVSYEGGSFDIRGIPFFSLATLLKNHFSELQTIYNMISDKNEDEIDVKSIVVKIISECPEFVARLIAIATDDDTEEGCKCAASLSFPLQLEALIKIVQLTFYEVGGVKKFISRAVDLLGLNK